MGHLLLDPRDAQQGSVPQAHFHPILPGVSSSVPKPQEDQNEGLHSCIPFRSPFPPASSGSSATSHCQLQRRKVCPLLLSSALHPVSWAWIRHAGCRIFSQNLTQLRAHQTGPWPTARQKQSSEPCTPATDPILPILPAAMDSLGHPDRLLRCLTVTAAKLTLHAGRSCPEARVSTRCTGYSALPYGVRLPSRAINTKAGRKQQQKALKLSFSCLGKSSLGWGCQSLQR